MVLKTNSASDTIQLKQRCDKMRKRITAYLADPKFENSRSIKEEYYNLNDETARLAYERRVAVAHYYLLFFTEYPSLPQFSNPANSRQ